LKKIFDLGINETAYYFYWPWRRSGTAEIAWLREVVETSPSARSRSNAWRCMLETRLASSFDIALAIASRVKLNAGPELYLDGVGFEHTGQGYRQLHPDSVYHLQFRADYFEDEAQPFHLRKLNHPTWQLTGTPSSDMVFGGSILEAVDSAARCAVCGGGLHHIFTMNPVPSDVGVSGLTTLTIGTCLSCLGWEEPEHFYQHDAFGCPIQIAYNGQTKVPQFPSEPLKQTTVSLVRTPERWLWQDWALANSRQNLHRVGGAPCFIQDSEYTRCPVCQQVMTFLLQLDSFMPSEDGVEWMWGSGGICYVFWCDHCWVSGISMQFT
jgi:hypothetical protein